MKSSLFDYRDYKIYFNDLIEALPLQGRGKRVELAQAIHCQKAFISQVLGGDYHFSLEQAEMTADFFGITGEEKEYLMLLVSCNRAGTPSLKKFYEEQLERKREENKQLESRLKIKKKIPIEEQAEYYRSWKYQAVHMLLTIPHYQTLEKVCEYFHLPKSEAADILHFLCSIGLVEKNKNLFFPSVSLLHLAKDSPFVSRHHANWRMKAIESAEKRENPGFHYSLVFSCSKKDLEKVRESIVKCLAENSATIQPSREEVVASLCVDLFEI